MSNVRRQGILPAPASLLAGVFLWGILFVPPALHAQENLRLQDVFEGEAPESAEAPSLPTLQELDENPELAEEMRTAIEQAVAAEQYPRVLAMTELLSAWYEKGSLEYQQVLWHRGQAFEGLDRAEELQQLSANYLSAYPDGPYRLWFLTRLATGLEQEGNLQDAAALWGQVASTEEFPALEQAMTGARVLLRTGRPEAAHSLLQGARAAGNAEELSQQMQLRYRFLTMETLLLSDDSSQEIPQPASGDSPMAPSYNLRRGLLMELRGMEEEALAIYRELEVRSDALREQERKVLLDRLENFS